MQCKALLVCTNDEWMTECKRSNCPTLRPSCDSNDPQPSFKRLQSCSRLFFFKSFHFAAPTNFTPITITKHKKKAKKHKNPQKNFLTTNEKKTIKHSKSASAQQCPLLTDDLRFDSIEQHLNSFLSVHFSFTHNPSWFETYKYISIFFFHRMMIFFV